MCLESLDSGAANGFCKLSATSRFSLTLLSSLHFHTELVGSVAEVKVCQARVGRIPMELLETDLVTSVEE